MILLPLSCKSKSLKLLDGPDWSKTLVSTQTDVPHLRIRKTRPGTASSGLLDHCPTRESYKRLFDTLWALLTLPAIEILGQTLLPDGGKVQMYICPRGSAGSCKPSSFILVALGAHQHLSPSPDCCFEVTRNGSLRPLVLALVYDRCSVSVLICSLQSVGLTPPILQSLWVGSNAGSGTKVCKVRHSCRPRYVSQPSSSHPACPLNTRLPLGYGSTETSPASCILDTNFAQSHRGCVGALVPNMEARLVDDDEKDVPVGSSGELWVRGPNIMKCVLVISDTDPDVQLS